MDISEIKQLKTDLRVEIAWLIAEFEKRTQVTVVDLDVIHSKIEFGQPDLVQVCIKTDIG